MIDPKPRIRPLEAIPVEVEDQALVILRDPFHYVEDALTVSVPVYLLLTLMDGTRTIFEVQQSFKEQYGGQVAANELETLIQELDEHYLMETDRFQIFRRKMIDDFRQSPIRNAAHAGSAYAADSGELAAQLASFSEPAKSKKSGLLGPDGMPLENPEADINTPPGLWLQSAEAPGSLPARDFHPEGAVRGLVAPHIDPRVGGRCAASAFTRLNHSTPLPDLYVVLGTAHQPSDSLFILTEKTFETPFGQIAANRQAAQDLQALYPASLISDEFLHKHEHSIEFQLIFLQHLHSKRAQLAGGSSGFEILPLLVGSFHDFLEQDLLPASQEIFNDFIAALREALRKSGRRACFIAGADLSHMGQKFGDPEELSDDWVASVREQDRSMLRHLERGDHDAFFRHLQTTEDRQKVCGLPPIYTMLASLEAPYVGHLLDYGLNVEEQTQSFVSFASMAFY